MQNRQTQFTESRRTGSNREQGKTGGAGSQRPTTSARGGAIAPDVQAGPQGGSHLVPKPADVQGPRTAERGGENRIGHQKHNPAEAKGRAGNKFGNDRVSKG